MTILKGWKTILFNIITGALAITEEQGLGFGLSPELITTILFIGNIILRFFTTTPLGKSK